MDEQTRIDGITLPPLPSGWVGTEMNDLLSADGLMSDGDWVESKDQDPNGEVRLIQLADVGDGSFLNKSSRYLTAQSAQNLNCTYLSQGDLLISRLGDPLGKACIFPGDRKECVTAVDVCIFRSGLKEINHRWLMYSIIGPYIRPRIEAQSSGTTRKRITGKKLKRLKVRIPPTNEQDRIVSKIDRLFSQIDAGEANLKRVQVLVKTYRQSILKAAVTGDLTRDWREKNRGKGETGEALLKRILAARRQAWEDAELAKLRAKGKTPKDDKWKAKYTEPTAPDTSGLPTLPEGWTWATVGQIAYVSGGVTKNAKRKDCPIKRPYLRVANVYERQLKLDEVHEIGLQISELERVTLEKNDLLIVEGNGSIDQIGRVALWDGTIPNCVHQNHLIKARFLDSAIAQFALAWCASPLGRSFIERAASSTSGLHTLSISKIESLPIPMPNELEIKMITECWTALESAVLVASSDAQNQFSRLSTLRQAVLRSAFCGTLVSQDPNDEPATELLKRVTAERRCP